MKICPRCKFRQRFDQFKKYRYKGKFRFYAFCQTCYQDPDYLEQRRKKAKENYYKNHEHRKAYGRKYQKIAWEWQKKLSALIEKK